MKKALVSFNWEQAPSNISVDKKISVLDFCFCSNVMSNYIPNETKVFDDQKPPWMNAETENLMLQKMRFVKNI